MKAVLFFMSIVLAAIPVFAEPQINDGMITDVIVYHGQALVTRTIELETISGDIELLVENLPERILPESLYAVSNDSIQILSVRYRVKEIEKDTRAEVKAIDEQIEQLQTEIYQAVRDHEFMESMWNKFCKMWELSFQGADISLNRAAFSSETMKDFTGYLDEKNTHYYTESVRLELLKKQLEKQLAKLTRQKEELASQHKSINRQALVYLHVPASAASNIVQLSYLVNDADWSPQYNLKADPDNKRVHTEYNAIVHQSSGEDWTNAILALSTAVPALVASPPELEPMKIGLISAEAKYRGKIIADEQSMKIQQQTQTMPSTVQQGDFYAYGNQTEKFGALVQSRRSNIAKGIKAQQELNTIAISNQMIEFEADKRMVQQLKEKAVAIRRTEGVSVMYSLPGKLTLPSKSDQQLVTIALLKTPAEFVFVAAPLLTDYVYLQAEITNDSNTILLPGPADMFRNGQFVGKGDMKLVTIGQTFTTGFGVDSQIQVTREFKDKKTDSFLGNRIDENYYRLAIDNYYDNPVALRLVERLPWTENKELAIELTNVSYPLSTDSEYLRTEKDKGILRWDLKLKPNTTGQNATIVNYAFTLKYDNDMAIRTVR
ncbi:MAG: DUF4139 domain-containing protein [Phycisphaerae bacterium]|nr:DUF4139 domain-containing protein [Phycisphaerae bacterium]